VPDGDDADEASNGSPQEVSAAIPDADGVIAVDRAHGLDGILGLPKEVPELDLWTVLPRATTASDGRGLGRPIPDGIASEASDQVIAGLEERASDLLAGVVGIRDDVEAFESEAADQLDESI
jgi:hypothetical protein